MRFLSGSSAALVVGLAAIVQAADVPDATAIFEEAHTSPERVLYQTGFEEANPPQLTRYYAGKVPSKVTFRGLTDEQAHGGKHSFKMQVEFESGRWGNAYFKLPIDIPQWSDLKTKFYVKIESLPKTWSFHGFVGAQASAGVTANNVNGEKQGEDGGWEVWEATARKSSDVGDYVQGIGLRMQLPDHSPATTVVMYIDDVTVTGKLPSNYKEKWADVYRYFTVDREEYIRNMGVRRHAGMNAYYDLLRRFKQVNLPGRASDKLTQRYAALCDKIDADLAAAAPLIAAVGRNLADKESRFTADLDKPERILSHLGAHIEAAQGYPAYAGSYGGDRTITFVLEPTRSYKALPGGPTGHNDELSHYSWSGGGYESPQLLPDVKAVPAKPSRALKGFGCRGTYVPLSFAIVSDDELRDLVVAAAAPLRVGSNVIGADNIDIRIVAPWYRPKNEYHKQVPRLTNEMLLHDPMFAVPHPDRVENIYKDPKYGNDADTLQPVTIPAGKLRQFHVTVRIPDNAAAGVYKGNVNIRAGGGQDIVMNTEVEVLPFDLEPTPNAYSFFYRSYLKDAAYKQEEGIHSWYKTAKQMQAELINMGKHGCNTLNLYDGNPGKTDDGWDLSRLDQCLAMAKRAGLTRSPFTWLGHGRYFLPMPERAAAPKTMDEAIGIFNRFVPLVNEFCDSKGYPRPALFGHDEASGERLMKLRQGYAAVNEAGGLVTVACYSSYFDEIGDALSLPIVLGGGQTAKGKAAIAASQKLGCETWIYNCPATNMAASPSVFRRRYGLAMWRNGENGAAPWEYQGVPHTRPDGVTLAYNNIFTEPTYCMAYPTWNGKPIDTIIYEAFREGIYDTRYMATLQKYYVMATEQKLAPQTTARVERWLAMFSVNDDLQQVRRQMATFIVTLMRDTGPAKPR